MKPPLPYLADFFRCLEVRQVILLVLFCIGLRMSMLLNDEEQVEVCLSTNRQHNPSRSHCLVTLSELATTIVHHVCVSLCPSLCTFAIPKNPYDPGRNPQGHIALCLAENKLVTDLVAERMMQPNMASVGFSHEEAYGYNSFLGLPIAREAMAYFLAKRFLLPDRRQTLTKEEALERINPQDVAFGSGCASLLHYLFYILGSDGDCCLVPAPFYAAFENDMKVSVFRMNGAIPTRVVVAPTQG